MGFLPIFIAVGGFIFLWVTLVYNGIKASKKDLNTISSHIRQLNTERHELIMEIGKREPKLSEQLSAIRKTVNMESLEEPLKSWEQQERHIQEQQIRMIEIDGFSEETEEMVTELAARGRKVRELVGRYYSGIRSYNRLIMKPPHRYLAGPLGFQPI
ncbi:MAG: hypothetical protein WBB45_18475 [Cyclobacteriaceae bacterium]